MRTQQTQRDLCRHNAYCSITLRQSANDSCYRLRSIQVLRHNLRQPIIYLIHLHVHETHSSRSLLNNSNAIRLDTDERKQLI